MFAKNIDILNRTFDIFFSIVLLIFFLPLVFIVVGVLFFTCEGSVFYKQSRIGEQGKKFKLYKFKTMYNNADELLKQYLNNNKKARKEWLNKQKLLNDPRITQLGWYLREYSIDEIPQLLNVIFGQMSLVGPRPIIEEEVLRYGSFYKQYITVKPGITGLWQISGRNNTTYKERVSMDMLYLKKKSILFDLYILIKTVPAVISKRGAY